MNTIAVTNPIILNSSVPKILVKNIQADFTSVASQKHKYIPLEKFAGMADDVCWSVIQQMVPYLKGGYKSTLVDYRVLDLEAGDCCCYLDHWHLDVVRNPYHSSRPENHLIFTTTIGTEFILDELECYTNDFGDAVVERMPYTILHAPVNAITQYGRYNLHRAPTVSEACRRVLIRVTQTDVM